MENWRPLSFSTIRFEAHPVQGIYLNLFGVSWRFAIGCAFGNT